MTERLIEVARREETGFVVVVLRGSLGAVETPQFEQVARQLVSSGSVRLIIDCSQVSFATSAGLRAFLALAKRVKTQNGCCRFAALTSSLREIFEISGFFTILEVHDSVEAALQ
ncbi:MAG: hypothetical protein B9S36_03710 [Verrucomicrobiia bacterium Tous-C2TDCM]|nr:MAG: hypothetical protein B9S36_03710 [Verrucomicrobiae bacterium Tous-C2TDCM]